MTADEKTLRELLWLQHGCHSAALYGDDGEMQCLACLIDFKRNTVESIEKRFYKLGIMALAVRQAQAAPEGGA